CSRKLGSMPKYAATSARITVPKPILPRPPICILRPRRSSTLRLSRELPKRMILPLLPGCLLLPSLQCVLSEPQAKTGPRCAPMFFYYESVTSPKQQRPAPFQGPAFVRLWCLFTALSIQERYFLESCSSL